VRIRDSNIIRKDEGMGTQLQYVPGRLNNKERYFQETDYSGLRVGNMTPTDLDGLLEYSNIAYMFFEVKYVGKSMPAGQKLALEHLAMDLTRAGKKTVVLIVEHEIENTNDIIPVGDCNVREVLFGCQGFWRVPKYALTAREAMLSFVNLVNLHAKVA
jgi:hypothetical protein